MENTELTQEEQDIAEQEQAYQDEYNKAFFGEDANTEEEVQDEPEEKEADEAENVNDETEQEESTEAEADAEGDGDDTADSGESMDDNTNVSDDESNTDDLTTITWKGKPVQVTQDEMIALAQKGFDYTSKTQELSKYKKDIEYLDRFSKEDLEILDRVKQGDKEALAHLVKSNGVEAVDLIDIEPNIALHNQEPEVLISEQVAPLVAEVESNPELLASMHDAVSKLPNAVSNAMQQDPEWFKAVKDEVKSGNFEKVNPKVQIKLAQMDGVDRAFYENNPQAYANLYADVMSSGVSQPTTNEAPKPVPVKKEKPNMAEVGVKRSGGNDRRAEVKKDAFTDDAAYQATLARMRRTIG